MTQPTCRRCGNPKPSYQTAGLGCPTYCDHCLLPYIAWLEQQVQRLNDVKRAVNDWETVRAPKTIWADRIEPGGPFDMVSTER